MYIHIYIYTYIHMHVHIHMGAAVMEIARVVRSRLIFPPCT